jgi:hypothetical protein
VLEDAAVRALSRLALPVWILIDVIALIAFVKTG